MVKTHDFGSGLVPAHQHINGGGWVAETAVVSALVYVGLHAQIYENAQVRDYARVHGNARVYGNALIYGNAQVCGNALICGNAQVYGSAFNS
mgnify:FL=1